MVNDVLVVQLEETENEHGPNGQSDERFQDGLDVRHFGLLFMMVLSEIAAVMCKRKTIRKISIINYNE